MGLGCTPALRRPRCPGSPGTRRPLQIGAPSGFVRRAEHLPSSVEAFLSSGTPEHAEIYQRFLDTYGLSEELVPLLIYNKAHPNPFQLASASGSTKYEVHSGNLDGLGFGRA